MIADIFAKNSNFKKNSDYENWLKDFVKPLSTTELNQMEKELSTFNSVNNFNFQPLKGA